MRRSVGDSKGVLAKTFLVFLLILGLVALFQPGSVNACSAHKEKKCFNPFDFDGILDGIPDFLNAPGAVATGGHFWFPMEWDFDRSYAEIEFGSWASASANVPTGEIKLYVRGTGNGCGKPFNLAAGGIYDNYILGEGVDPDTVNVSIKYEGSLTAGFNGFMVGLFGDEGFQFFGKYSQGNYDGVWSVPLAQIASVDEGNEFTMAFGALVFARGSQAEATFNDTFHLSFVSEDGDLVFMPESDGGYGQVPIPSTLLLLGGGLVGIFRMRKKRSS